MSADQPVNSSLTFLLDSLVVMPAAACKLAPLDVYSGVHLPVHSVVAVCLYLATPATLVMHSPIIQKHSSHTFALNPASAT